MPDGRSDSWRLILTSQFPELLNYIVTTKNYLKNLMESEEAKSSLESDYKKAFSEYNKSEQAFFETYRSKKDNWDEARLGLIRSWKAVEKIILKMIDSRGVQGTKRKN
jgi:hypothetical protein